VTYKAVFDRLFGETSAEDRVYSLVLPQNPTYPAISFQQISAARTHAMGSDGPLVRVRMQVNNWGRTYADARTLAGEVLARLSRFKGTSAGIQILDVLLDNELDTYEMDAEARRVIQDYTIFVEESV
jgi:hypothetical protein